MLGTKVVYFWHWDIFHPIFPKTMTYIKIECHILFLWYVYFSDYYYPGNGTPLQYSCLANPMDRGAWWAAVHGVTKSRTLLRDFPFTFLFHALEQEMATHSSVLAWRIPGTVESGGLPSMSMGSHRVGHDWSDLAAAEVFTNQTFIYSISQVDTSTIILFLNKKYIHI